MSSKRIPISVSARLIRHLGDQLISDELVAVLELIKNAYDADATRCSVIVDSYAMTKHGQGVITITDNGNGMLPHIVENDFLRIATEFKKENKISPYFRRRTLGEKGLGRLSYQRLGCYLSVETVPRVDRLVKYMTKEDNICLHEMGFNTICVIMDWETLSEYDDITDVFAIVSESKKDSSFAGTTIRIEGIRNLSFWRIDNAKRKRFKDELLALLNPFVESKSKGAFNVVLDVDGEKFFVDSIDEGVVSKLSDVSCHFSFDGHILKINAEFKRKYIDRQKEQYIKYWEDRDFELAKDSFDYSKYSKRLFAVNLDNNEGWERYCQINSFSLDRETGSPAVDFSFDGGFYAIDKKEANRSPIEKALADENSFIRDNFSKIGKLWDHIAGVFMYRDQFRILPYGKKDWLGLTERSQKGKATILKQGNVCGYVKINGELSERIREQTNRQGIIEDEFGSNFLTILDKVIIGKLFEWDTELRGVFTSPKSVQGESYCFSGDRSIAFNMLNNAEESFRIARKNIGDVLKNANCNNEQLTLAFDSEVVEKLGNLSSSVESFIKASDSLKASYSQKIALADSKLKEYDEVFPLLGQSLIVETMTHELSRIYSNLLIVSKELQNNIQGKGIKDRVLSSLLLNLRSNIYELDLQLNHLLPTQRFKLRDSVVIDISSFIRKQYISESAVSKRLKKNGISCVLKGTDSFNIESSLGNLIVVFDNIIMNSEYWLLSNKSELRQIVFEPHRDGLLYVWDSGDGIDKAIEDTLFEPFRSMKRDGRGLGLFIVHEILALMNASIELLPDRNSHDNRYIFCMSFRGEKS